MMAGEDAPKYAKGFRFNPFDHELINDYLKPKIMGEQLPCNMIKYKEVYGPSSNPWYVFDTKDCNSWYTSPSLKKTEKFMFVFVKLSKLSRSNNGTWKNTSKKAGCGTWVGKGKQDQIVDGEGNLIGEKRYLVFEINDIESVEDGFDFSKVGCYRMHEYSLSGVNVGLNSAGITVLCKITYDSSKECPINLKSGTRIDGKFLSSSEAHTEEENNNKNIEGTSNVKAENLTVLDSGVSVGENLEESKPLASENLDVIESGGGSNLVGSRTLTSDSLVVTKSDASDPYAAARHNNSLQVLNGFGGGFCFGHLGGQDFCLDDLDYRDGKWFMACMDPNEHEEPSGDCSSRKFIRKFESEENLYHSKKMCLDNPN